jgi:hypothetical protein
MTKILFFSKYRNLNIKHKNDESLHEKGEQHNHVTETAGKGNAIKKKKIWK